MKIAILTIPHHLNYGGVIQNYALQTVLERMGHEVYTININYARTKKDLAKAPFSFAKRFFKKMQGRKDGILFRERKLNQDKQIVEQHISKFINKNIHLTKPYYTKKDLLKINNEDIDAVIVGSDQVWRIPYVYPDIETFFLDFITNKHIKKIAYSASFGTDKKEFSKKEAQKCGRLIKEFEVVSVRESTGIDLINKTYHWTCKNYPVHTLDPTMLLQKEDYISISSEYENQLDGELFYYILDMTEDKKNVLEKISKDTGYKPFTVMRKSDKWYDNANDKLVPPLELWLQAFHKARYIFTDSFHGCVFSIIFNKDFIVYGNTKRGMTRFESILNMFHLKDRLILSQEEYNNQLTINHVNWNLINNILEENKHLSLKILESSI